jgi:hypothetical protein
MEINKLGHKHMRDMPRVLVCPLNTKCSQYRAAAAGSSISQWPGR